MPTPPAQPLPYKLACLCDIRDADNRVLLIRRRREPNFGLCSPIGGKLDMPSGESPAQCAQREILEEAGLRIPIERLHLGGLISERAFEGKGHWLMFYYRVLGPVTERVLPEIAEGTLEWFSPEDIDRSCREVGPIPLPETDRRIIWPMIRKGEKRYDPKSPASRPGFFALHIDCSVNADGTPGLTWSVEQDVDSR